MIFQVIEISGKQSSGKSTLSAEIRKLILEQNKDFGVIEIIFAGAIYEMHDACRNILKSYGIKIDQRKDGPLLQFLGTEWGRKNFGENVWVDIVKNKIKQYRLAAKEKKLKGCVIVIPDLRFKNEVGVYPGSIKVRLECQEFERKQRCDSWRPNTQHQSEIDLDDCPEKFNFIFDTSAITAPEIAKKLLSDIGLT